MAAGQIAWCRFFQVCSPVWVTTAEAHCKHLVELAQAEVAANPQASETMRVFARIRTADAEVGVHRLFKAKGYSCPVSIDDVNLGPGKLEKFPVIKISTWFQYLLDTNRLARQLVGVSSIAKMKPVLREFWERQRAIRPDHGIFELAENGSLTLESCIPYFSHSDEGRSYKHMPLFVLSSHGALGRGTNAYVKAGKHRAPLCRNGMGVNFLGKTWSTNFIFAAVLKTVSTAYPESFDKLITEYAADAHKLLAQGLVAQNGERLWFIHWGTKGDLPALQKLAGFKRSFNNVPKAASSKKACKGVCFLCKAGQEADASTGALAIPYENVSPSAEWVATCSVDPAWELQPTILNELPLSLKQQIEFFRTDLWHNAHLGLLKHFTASGFVCIVESDLASLPGGSIEVKFAWLTTIYRAYFRSPPYVSEISRDTLNFPASTANPIGKWSKGAASTQMMQFLSHFGKTYILGKSTDRLLLAIAPCFPIKQNFCCPCVWHVPILKLFLKSHHWNHVFPVCSHLLSGWCGEHLQRGHGFPLWVWLLGS